jgi:hypothetical protein
VLQAPGVVVRGSVLEDSTVWVGTEVGTPPESSFKPVAAQGEGLPLGVAGFPTPRAQQPANRPLNFNDAPL